MMTMMMMVMIVTVTTTKVIWQKAESPLHVHPTPRLYSPGSSMKLTVWLQCVIACFGWGLTPYLPFSVDQGPQPI